MIKCEIESLAKEELLTLWFSTNAFQEMFEAIYWDDDPYIETQNEDNAFMINSNTIYEQILSDYVLSAAADEDNERIGSYLYGQ